MGRAERRKSDRADRLWNNKNSIKVTRDELERMRAKTMDDAGRFDTEVFLTCFALTLHDEFGFGFKRVQRALGGIDDLFGKVLNDEIDLDFIKERLRNEVGINITV